jgi:glutaredoxin
MASFGDRLFDTVDRLANRADHLLDKVRKTPRRRLTEEPVMIEAPDPFTKPAATATAGPAPVEPPLGDVKLPAQVYGRRTDDKSGFAVRTLRDRGVDARFINLDDPEQLTTEKRLVRDTKQYEMPWVFVKGEFVGNYDALERMAREGKLDEPRAKRGA